eukprot:12976452-Alexandrium_andersonii.AAC.1
MQAQSSTEQVEAVGATTLEEDLEEAIDEQEAEELHAELEAMEAQEAALLAEQQVATGSSPRPVAE